MEKLLRSGKVISDKKDERNVEENVEENVPDKVAPTTSRTSNSRRSRTSTYSKKTLLEARARREMAELEKQRLENEKVLVQARLSEELAQLGENDTDTVLSDDGQGSNSVQQWVNQTLHYPQAEATADLIRPQPDRGIEHLAHAITDAIKATTNPSPTSDKLIGRLTAKDLPTFSGDALDFLRFKNAFVTTTKIGQYTDEENVARLQRCLTGEAWEAVAARLITVTSADDIMKTLEIRFGRPDLVLNKLITDMRRVPKLSGARSELVLLATKVSNCVAAIEATEQRDYLCSPELATEVIGKLTEPLIYRWLDYWSSKIGHQPKLAALSDYLMYEAERVCKAGVVEPPNRNIRPTQPFLKRAVLFVDEKPDDVVNAVTVKKPDTKCSFCAKIDHTIDKCPTFTSLEVNKRWEWVCNKKLCFRCLSSNHRRDRCRSKRTCTTCKRGHHNLLHNDDWPIPEGEVQQSATTSETAANLWDEKQTKKVFLKILPVDIEGPAGRFQTYALLDEGSTVSLIERNIADAIGAQGPQTRLNIHGAVGDSLQAPSQCVSLTIRTLEGDYELERVRTVDKLTLPTQSLNHSDLSLLPHLSDIDLQTFRGKPTLIIGQDYWHLIVSRQIREGKKNEPVASLTRLGWVLHGFASGSSEAMIEHSCHLAEDPKEEVFREEEKRLNSDVTAIHKAGGFEIRGWTSNKSNVLPQPLDSTAVCLLTQEDGEARTLGLIWKPGQNLLGFDVSLKKVDQEVASGLRRPTKREMLKVIMSIFDPLGFLCPLLIRAKILLQDIWRSGVQWDEQIGEKASDVWFGWLTEVKKCQHFSIPRCYGFTSFNDLELHVFADASEQAYAAVAYLRREGEVSFVAAKSRVAPLKSSTIPRLELQAALMGARSGATINKEQDVKITKRYFWTDSQTVWWWIQNNPRQKLPFVSSRLSEIDDLTGPQEWRWLPGRLNVADCATRADGSLESANSRWICGPDFLHLDKSDWPSMVPQMPYKIENEPVDSLVVAVLSENKDLVDSSRFSNWRRMLRCVAMALVFSERCKKIPSHLTPDHERRAETLILRQIPRKIFPEEIRAVQNRTQLNSTSRLRNVNPKLDDEGLLRVNSRIVAGRGLPASMTEPIILDGSDSVTRMMIEYKHRLLGHHSMETLINEIRQKYYVLRLRQTVRSIIAHCVICKARRARCEQPMMAGLPPARLQHHCRPFTYCGVDLFGPMLVTIGRRNEKRWGVLFTCLSTRAVSIELASSLSADSAILAIRRMSVRRGYPRQIYSDNGTNFRAADKELREAAREVLKDPNLTSRTEALGIEWKFNPPDAPHMGGAWERLVRSIKTALYATLHSRAPKEEVLATLIAEAENIVNSRPLTHVSLDPNEEEALTPNHFLLGSSNALSRPGEFSDNDLHLRKQWRIAQRLTDHFWSRWVREYLPSMHERRKWTGDTGPNICVGDLVLIADCTAPRNVWPRGRVTATTPGRDGRVRIVDVATSGGTLRRPATKLVVLLRETEPLSATTTGVP